MKNIFVTGGTGFLGSHLLYKLIERGHSPIAIKRENSNLNSVKNIFAFYSNKKVLFKKIHWINADLTNPIAINNTLNNIDTVFHCAAMVSFNPQKKDLLFETNYIGTKNLVNLCLKRSVSKFCFVSSIATLSNTKSSDLLDEHSWFSFDEKKSNYAISKYLAEMEVWRGFSEGLNGFIINPSLIIGPGDTNSLFANMIKKLKNTTIFYPKGGTGFVDVRDVANILIKLEQLKPKNERYIVNGENLSFKSFVEIFSKKMNLPQPKVPINNVIIKLYILINKLINPKNTLSFNMIEFFKSEEKFSNEKIKKELKYNFIKMKESLKSINIP